MSPVPRTATDPQERLAGQIAEILRRLRQLEASDTVHEFVFARLVREASAGNQAVIAGATVAVDFTAVEYDTHAGADLAANQYTIPVDGLYVFQAYLKAFGASQPIGSATLRRTRISDGATNVIDNDTNKVASTTTTAYHIATTYPCKTGDIITWNVTADPASAATIIVGGPVGAAAEPWLCISRVGIIPPGAIVY